MSSAPRVLSLGVALTFERLDRRAFDILKSYFASVVLTDQDCFRQEDQWETILSLLPDKSESPSALAQPRR